MNAIRNDRAPFYGLVALVALVVAGFLLAVAYAGSVIREVKGAREHITVKGFHQQPIRSDFATWNGDLTVRSALMEQAYAKIQQDLEKVRAYLTKSGLDPQQVSFSPISLQPRYRQTERGFQSTEIEQYELTQSIIVRSTDVERVDTVAKDITSLIREGVELHSYPANFHYLRLDDLKIEMLGAAAEDAHERARQIATSSGAELGPLQWANQGVFQITAAYSTEVSSEGFYDTSTIDKTVRAVVTVSYGVR